MTDAICPECDEGPITEEVTELHSATVIVTEDGVLTAMDHEFVDALESFYICHNCGAEWHSFGSLEECMKEPDDAP